MFTPQLKSTFYKFMSSLRRFSQNSYIIRKLYYWHIEIYQKDYLCKHAKVINHGFGNFNKRIIGNNNLIQIGRHTHLIKPVFRIKGNNNSILIEDDCVVGKGCSFWMEGNNIQISIGKGTTFTQFVHFNAQENNMSIVVGNDCMFSNHIIVRTSDSHPIYNIKNNERINQAKSITIGSHVWIAPDTKIMKGSIIGDNSIIGSNSIVNNEIPSNCIAVGMPAKIVKENIKWTREDIIFSKKK